MNGIASHVCLYAPSLGALPATAALATLLAHPDAELLELESGLTFSMSNTGSLWKSRSPVDEAFARLLREDQTPRGLPSLFEQRDHYRALWARADAERGRGPVVPYHEDIAGEIGPMMSLIMAIPASTIDGLAVKARGSSARLQPFLRRARGGCGLGPSSGSRLV